MYEKEKLIREQRTIEATKKGLMGLDGKLGCVLRYLGRPIISESSEWYQSNESEDFHSHLFEEEEEQKKELPEMDLDTPVNKIGWHFDGLSRGMHLEITYRDARRDEVEGMVFNELRVCWKGHSVYREIAGELFQYVPNPDWETCVERLYVFAKKRENESRKEDMADMKLEVQREKLSFLDTMRRLWGI